MLPLLLPLGVLAGALTTVAGLGGGMLLLLALSLAGDPAQALAVTAPALLLGNLHRAAAHRRAIDRRFVAWFALAALPGAVLGGALAAELPPAALRALLLVATGLGVFRALRRGRAEARGGVDQSPGGGAARRVALSPALVAPAGFGIGAATGAMGGAGLLVAPLLLGAGLTGAPYVATGAAVSVAMHAGRLIAYGSGGLITRATALSAAALAVAIFAGNLAGERARRHIDAELGRRIELATLVVCVALAVSGAA